MSAEGFLASAPQLVGTFLVSALLIAVALCARGPSLPRTEGPAPSPWVAGAVSLAMTSGLMLFNVWTLGRSTGAIDLAGNTIFLLGAVAILAAAASALRRYHHAT